ncbi:MAG TPA: tyrosine-type recombinase/integrase, partial [Ignavibacteriaceae bacterium]
TKVSTKTADKFKAEVFKATFNPDQKPKQEPPQKYSSLLLSNFIKEYKTYVTNTYSEKYLKKAVTPAFNQLVNFIPDISLEEISPKNLDQFISTVYAKSKFAASLYHRTLKAAFNKAVIWNYISENPFNKIKTPKVTKSFPVYLSEAELIQIINKTEDQLLKNIFITAFYTGMRLNEILNMKWNWIDFTQDIITVKNSDGFKTKSKRERIIPIHPKVKSILLTYFPLGNQPKNDLIFYRKKNVKLNSEFISKQFKVAVRAAELNDYIHFHNLRHSFASNLVQRGVNLYVVKELLGHENIKTTQVYSHLTQSSLSNAVSLL